jgi:SAM-dependent methyltransferase
LPEPITPVRTTPLVSTFDEQAGRYDDRAGIPASAGTAVARALLASANAQADILVVELGAGTGEIGVHLTSLPIRYVGLDVSAPMLDLFRAKAGNVTPSLIVADCNHEWPLPDGGATAIFASRVIHLLDPEHVTRETLRVARSRGTLMLGRVLREPQSIKSRLRRRRHELLREAGFSPRDGEEGTRRVVDCCLAAGAQEMGRPVVAEWSGEATPATVIAGWEGLPRMGNQVVDVAMRAEILQELRQWAKAEFGDLERAQPFRERYAIDIVRLP